MLGRLALLRLPALLSRLPLLPALVNGNWGGVWSNARYAFRVTFSDGTTSNLKLTLTGEAAAVSPTAAATNAPGTAGGAPVTGDDTPIVMYIIILAVLIVALAVVLIIVMKRRNSGSSSRH